MAIALVEHSAAGFSDGGSGHVISFTGSPSVGHLDIVTVNSNTTVTTPSGFTIGRSRVSAQGSYIYYRIAAGGESANVTLTTSGNHSTAATWSRWSGASAIDVAVDAGVNASAGLTTPALSTGTLVATNELVVVLAALHNLSSGATPSAPSWSSGYTPLDTASDITGSGGNGAHVAAFVAYRTNAGTAAEAPNCTWTSNANDRYVLALTFTPAAAGSVDGALAATLPALTTATAGTAVTAGVLAATMPAISMSATAAPRIIARPNTGTTARPDTGRVIRPNTGTVTRP